MSFPINLYTNGSNPNVVSKNITLVNSVTGTLRGNTSIINPVVTLEDYVPDTLISQVNYCEIPSFHRYYYITNIVTTNSRFWEVHMHVDVLMSFEQQIRQQSGIIARQENLYNMYLDDGWFTAYQNSEVVERTFSVKDPFAEQEYVLIVAGSGPDNG